MKLAAHSFLRSFALISGLIAIAALFVPFTAAARTRGPGPTAPTALAATASTKTSISVSWSPSSSLLVSGYGLYRNGTSVGSTTNTSYTFDGLACGTSYTLAVDAYDTFRKRSAKSSITASTAACAAADTQAPSVPSGMTTSGIGQTSVKLSWAASTDNVGVTGYNLYRDGVKTGSTAATSYTFSGLACGTTYTLALTAYDAAGNESDARYSTTTETTGACTATTDTQAPTVPGGLATTGSTATSVSVGWTASSDNVGVSSYGAYRNGTSVGSATGTSYTYSGLACGTSYTLAVDAVDAAGNRSAKSSITASTAACAVADTQAPSVPSGMTTSGIGQTSVKLSWIPSTDNVGVAGYNLYRDGAKSSSTTSASYTFTGLACGTTYTLALTAYDAAGNESDGRYATTTETTSACSPAPGDTQAPTVPGGLATTGNTATSISVGWSAATDNVGVTGYGVYRNGSSVSSTGSTSYTYSGLVCGTSYTLAVDAVDGAGNRSAKSSITASTAACATGDTQAPTTPGSLTVTGASASTVSVSWTASLDNVGVTGYGAYLNGGTVGSSTGSSYTFNGLACGTAYSLAINAYDAAGNQSAKATVSGSTSACPASGANLFVSTGGSDSGSCTQSAPCKSFGRAYQVAQPGQVVEVAGGTYPTQTVNVDSSKTSSNDVIFKPAAGATVIVDCNSVGTVGNGNISGGSCIDLYGSHITFDGGPNKGFRTQTYSVNGFSYQGRVDTERGSSDISFLNMDVGSFALGSPNSRIANNDIGPSVDPLNIMIVEEANGAVIENNLIHDFVIQNGGHFECMYWQGPDNVTLRNNEFRSCAVYGLHAKEGTHNNELVENNVFWNPRGLTTQADVQFTTVAYPCSNVTVRNNTFTDGLIDDCSPTAVSGNVFREATSTSGSGWTNNMSGLSDSTFANAGAGDFHLGSSSPAIHAGDPGNFPATDKDGKSRTSPPDAGAFKY
jgi:chitodextrinase